MPVLHLRPIQRQAPIEITIDSKTIAFDKFTIPLDTIFYKDGKGFIKIGNQISPFYACKKEKHLEIWIDGKIYKFEIMESSRRAHAPHEGADGVDITAPMPGKILKILVDIGNKIKADEPLIIMESMKMEMTLSSGGPGKIAKINFKTGDLVDMGALLVEITP